MSCRSYAFVNRHLGRHRVRGGECLAGMFPPRRGVGAPRLKCRLLELSDSSAEQRYTQRPGRRHGAVKAGPMHLQAQRDLLITIVSPVTRAGEAQSGADAQSGQAIAGAARRKRRQTCPELVRARRCSLVVVGVEIGSRFRTGVATWLRLLARHRASASPPAMQPAARSTWVAQWSGLLVVATHMSAA